MQVFAVLRSDRSFTRGGQLQRWRDDRQPGAETSRTFAAFIVTLHGGQRVDAHQGPWLWRMRGKLDLSFANYARGEGGDLRTTARMVSLLDPRHSADVAGLGGSARTLAAQGRRTDVAVRVARGSMG